MLNRYKTRARGFVRNQRAFQAGVRDAAALPPPLLMPTAQPTGRLERYFDEVEEGPGVWKWRHYFGIYERYLSRFVGQDFTLVEVGIYSGGSLPMWREYFGPGCRIVGVDIVEACRAYSGPGIEVHIGDQADPAFWKQFRRDVPHVDVLIDDGGHAAHQQVATLKAMLPHIRPGGVYLCEDVQGRDHAFLPYVEGLTRSMHELIDHNGEQPSSLHQHIESVHVHPMVVVIEKPAAAVPVFEAPKHGTVWEPHL